MYWRCTLLISHWVITYTVKSLCGYILSMLYISVKLESVCVSFRYQILFWWIKIFKNKCLGQKRNGPFIGQTSFLTANQQCQSTEEKWTSLTCINGHFWCTKWSCWHANGHQNITTETCTYCQRGFYRPDSQCERKRNVPSQSSQLADGNKMSLTHSRA